MNCEIVKWRNCLRGAMITVPNENEIKKALGAKYVRKAKRETIRKLLAFIECIPLTMRGPMSDALTTLFDITYYWGNAKSFPTITFSDGTEIRRKNFNKKLRFLQSCFYKTRSIYLHSGKIYVEYWNGEKSCFPNFKETVNTLYLHYRKTVIERVITSSKPVFLDVGTSSDEEDGISTVAIEHWMEQM